jgi:hypothetical protein
MSALMADRRDWAEEPRQPSLFDALAPPPVREKPEAGPREEARIVEFPKRREPEAGEPAVQPVATSAASASAPIETSAVGGSARVAASDGAPGAPIAAGTSFATASEFELAAELRVSAPVPEDAAVLDTTPAVEGASAIEAEIVVTPEGFTGGTRTPRAAGAPLARPTLDDVMSRVWEGLSTGLPAACPVCQGELQPAASGLRQAHCGSCGSTID